MLVMYMANAPFDMAALAARLECLADTGYRELNLSLIPGVSVPVLGVRVPLLRALAKELKKGDWRGFLEASRDYPLYEVRLLHAIVLATARCPIGEKIALTDAFLPRVDNWAVCDTFCSSFKPSAGDKEAVFEFVRGCAESDIEFRKRFGLVMLMSRFHEPPYLDGVMDIYRRFSHPGYYARMGAAWGLATLYLYDREAALSILSDRVWDPVTHNKAIQKLRESWRVPDEDKRMLNGLRRKADEDLG